MVRSFVCVFFGIVWQVWRGGIVLSILSGSWGKSLLNPPPAQETDDGRTMPPPRTDEGRTEMDRKQGTEGDK